jgi:hypothetical protein
MSDDMSGSPSSQSSVEPDWSELSPSQITDYLEQKRKPLEPQEGFFNGSIFEAEVPVTIDKASCLLASYDGVNNVTGILNFT